MASVTDAMTVVLEERSADTAAGCRLTARWAAGPGVCVNVALPDTLGLTEPSVAVIVDRPALVVAVTVAV